MHNAQCTMHTSHITMHTSQPSSVHHHTGSMYLLQAVLLGGGLCATRSSLVQQRPGCSQLLL